MAKAIAFNWILLMALLFTICPFAFAEGEDSAGIVVSTGPTYSKDNKIGLSADVNIIYLIVNASAEHTWWPSKNVQAFRGYAGVGIGGLFKIQGGFGEGGFGLRVRSTVPISWVIGKKKDPWFPPPKWKPGFYRSDDPWFKGRISRGPVLSPYLEIRDGDTRVGLNIGLLF